MPRMMLNASMRSSIVIEKAGYSDRDGCGIGRTQRGHGLSFSQFDAHLEASAQFVGLGSCVREVATTSRSDYGVGPQTCDSTSTTRMPRLVFRESGQRVCLPRSMQDSGIGPRRPWRERSAFSQAAPAPHWAIEVESQTSVPIGMS